MNRLIVIDRIRKIGLLSRSDIAASTGLNRATVSSIVDDLIQDRIVIEADLQDSRGGRPGKNVQLNPHGGYAIGIDIEVGFVSIIATDLTANVLFRREIQMTPPQPYAEIMQKAEYLISEALAFGKAQNYPLIGIGVAIPGIIDSKDGCITLAPNLAWRNIPLKAILTDHFNLPIFVENDANYGAYGEYIFGAGRESSSLLYVSTGIGLGGGIILNGQLMVGRDGYAGEIGHTVIDVNGSPCACGKRGCWETFVNEIAICQYIKELVATCESYFLKKYCERGLDSLTFSAIFSAAKAGERVALQTLEHLAYYLGLGIGNMINIFNPEIVVLGGVYSPAYPLMRNVLEKTAAETVLKPNKRMNILPAACGGDAVLMGAVGTVIDAKLHASN